MILYNILRKKDTRGMFHCCCAWQTYPLYLQWTYYYVTAGSSVERSRIDIGINNRLFTKAYCWEIHTRCCIPIFN